MATILIETDLDVVSKQRQLVEEALGADGVYIRMKNTLEDLLAKGEIKGTDRAKVVAETIAGMSGQITTTCISGGLQWAEAEKRLALQKEEMQYQLDILAQNKLLAENQVAESLSSRQLRQAQLRREYGTPTLDTEGNVIALADDGKEYATIQNIEQDTSNKVTQGEVLVAQKEQTFAQTHKIVADTYINHGVFNWTGISDTGLTGVTKLNTGYTTLSDMQKYVASEQAKGYAYNAWGNAASSSGGMIGTLIAAEIPNLDPTTYLNTWKAAVDKINGVTAPTITL